MFAKGDKIVYPMYGAGVIEEIQDKIIDGEERSYYVLNIPVGSLTIKVSVTKAKDLGLRDVYDCSKVIKIINSYTELKPVDVPENWNQRYRANMEKIRTGELIEVVEVFRNLTYREKEKGLSSAEKKMLTTVKQIILSEMVLTQEITKDEAEEVLAESFQNCYN